MNNVFLIGRLTNDVDIRTAGGTSVARAGIACDRKFSKEKATDFFNLVAFGKTAEFLSKYFSKGSKIIVEGRLKSSKYKDKDGFTHSSIDIVCEQIEFGESKRKDTDSAGTADKDFGGKAIDDDSDTPF